MINVKKKENNTEKYLFTGDVKDYVTRLKTESINKQKKGTNTYCFLDSEKTMAHPASGRAVSTDVGEALLMITIGSAE